MCRIRQLVAVLDWSIQKSISRYRADRSVTTALPGHCYRMLGSAVDADDATQETIIRAWKNADQFEGRAALLTWLYRIATNVCIAELSDRRRRARPIEERPAGAPTDSLVQRPHTHWIEPVPDARAIAADADPSERAMLRQSIRLAFVAALQSLAPKQRAALLLVEVLGWSVAEVAEALGTSIASVNSDSEGPRYSRGPELACHPVRTDRIPGTDAESICRRF